MSDPILHLTAGDRALFASDMHLGDHDPETAARFLDRLQALAAGASHLFLLGDLFEVWIGDDWADRVCAQAIDALAALSAGSCQLFVMRGNRDFLLDQPLPTSGGLPGFAQRTGAAMLDDPCLISLFGQRTLLSHGDAWCTDDLDYQRFRALTRDAAWQAAFLARSLEERIAIAQDLRARSALSKMAKAEDIMDVNPDAVTSALRATQATLLVHSHTRRPARHALTVDGRPAARLVLPDWDAAHGRGGFLVASAEGIDAA